MAGMNFFRWSIRHPIRRRSECPICEGGEKKHGGRPLLDVDEAGGEAPLHATDPVFMSIVAPGDG